MAKVRVPVANTAGKSILINSGATVGATIGTDLRLPDGTVPSLTALAAALAAEAVAAEQTRSFQQLIDSIAPRQVPVGAVTQHEAALTILESQITDANILARIAADELITGKYGFKNAGGIEIWDAGGTDKAAFSHNGISFTTAFTNTTLWRLSGLSDGFYVDARLTVEGGGVFQVQDVANNAAVAQTQGAADFGWVGINVTDWNISGITALNAGTMDADFDALTATSHGGIIEANLVDKSAPETIAGAWTFNAGKFLLQTGVSNPSHAEGLIYYDDTIHAVSYYNEEAEVAVNLGQENLVRVRNASGSTITNGQLVYISGQVGNRPKVELAKADALATAQVLGMATHDIENNSDGYITTLGTVNLLNTSGDTEGAQIYLSKTTAGDYTETAPTGASEFIIPLGFIMTANVATGRIYVSVAAALPHPAALSSFSGSTIFSASDGDILHRDAGVWKNTAGALTWDGSALATTGIVSLPAGAVGAPSRTFTGDLDTGSYRPGADIYAIAAGAVETVRYTEASSQILADHSMETGITASTTQTQGQRPLLSSYNEIGVVTNNDDVVTMPPAAAGRRCLVINKGAKRLQLFPESGDDIGAGVDTSVTIKTNTSLLFVGIDGTTWHDVATRLESLQGVDLTGAADDDFLVRVAGIWEDTGGLLTWDGSLLDITGDLQVSGDVGFYGTAAVAQQTSVPVTAAGVHAAMVNLGLITA